MKKLVTLAMIFIGMVGLTSAQTTIPSVISTDQTWGPSGNPYLVVQNSYVDTGATITILPGTIIKSTVNKAELAIGGEIVANGKMDSMISFDGFTLLFLGKNKSYNVITGNGLQFKYCLFEGSYDFLRLPSWNIKVAHCSFQANLNRCIEGADTAIIENCDFRGGVFPFKSSSHLKATNSTFSDFNRIAVSGEFENNIFRNFHRMDVSGTFENNTCDSFNIIGANRSFSFRKNRFSNFSEMTFRPSGLCRISCNIFRNSIYGVEIEESFHNGPGSGVIFEYNTLDSMGGFQSIGWLKPMLSYKNRYSNPNTIFNSNNFLTLNPGISEKLVLQQPLGNKPLVFINARSNYWGTTDSATIESYIKDAMDVSWNFYRADFSNYASSQITPNCDNQKACHAKFNYSVEVDTVTFVDSSTAANAYTRTWIYGDGSNGGHTFKKHLYNPGAYNACLAIVDNITGCRDTFCTSITVKGKSSCAASYYFGIDTSGKFMVYLINDSKGITSTTQFLWDFGDGTTSTLRKPNHTYKLFKKYRVCLSLKDSAKNCFSTYCDSVGMDSLKKFLIGPGFNFNVIEEDEWKRLSVWNDEKAELKIFPNPSSGKVYIALNEQKKESVNVKVISSLGLIVHSEAKYNSNFELDLEHLPNGLYHIVIRAGKKVGSAHIIINK